MTTNEIINIDNKSIDINEIILKVDKATTAYELDQILTNVKPGIGKCDTRRKLKRLLENKINNSDISNQLNSKLRRKFTRLINILKSGNVNASVTANVINEPPKDQLVKQVISKPIKKSPFVVFVGQLPFDITKEQLENHLRVNDITGSIKIRILTDPESNTTKGTAFVELENKSELLKCIDLHHSYINNRRINIEESCGGRNKEIRQTKILDKKQEQMKKKYESVNQLIDDYIVKGLTILTNVNVQLLNKLYHLHINDLTSIFDNLLDNNNQSINELERLIYVTNIRKKRQLDSIEYDENNIDSYSNNSINNLDDQIDNLSDN